MNQNLKDSSCRTNSKPGSVTNSESIPKIFSAKKCERKKGGKGVSSKKKKEEKCNFKDIRSFFQQKSEKCLTENEKSKIYNVRQTQKLVDSGGTNAENNTYSNSAHHKCHPGKKLIPYQISALRQTRTDVQTEPPDSNKYMMKKTSVQTEPTDSKLNNHEIPANRLPSRCHQNHQLEIDS